MALLTGEEVRARGLNPDTMVSIGGKYDLGQASAPSSPASNPYSQAGMTQAPSGGDPNRMLTGEEVRAMGINPDTLISQGGKYSLSQLNQSGGGMAGGALGAFGNMPTINLPDLYKGLYESAGISKLEAEIAEKERQKTEVLGKINDNPYLSEGTRVGRVAKIEELHADRTKNLRDELATKKADIETQLNLQSKQFDINSQQSTEALARFNSLLSAGALDNASGETIAQLTRMTGISSDMINSAVKSRADQNKTTQVVTSTNDAGVVTVSVIDPKTGEIISQKSLGAIGNAQNSGGTASDKATALKSQMVGAMEAVKNSYGHVSPQDWQGAMASWISRGGDAVDFIANFKQYADPNRGDFDQAYYERK